MTYLRKSNMAVFTHKILNNFADSLLRLYLVVLIYNLTSSVIFAVLYLMLSYVLQTLIVILLKKFVTTKPVLSLIINICFIIFMYLLLYFNLFSGFWLALIIGTISGCAYGFYWVPINLIFATSIKKGAGKEYAKFEIGSVIGRMLATLIGAFLLYNASTNLLVIISIVLYILSIVPMILAAKEIKNEITLYSDNFDQKLSNKDIELNKSFNLHYILVGFFDFCDYFWPLYMAIHSLNYINIGFAVFFTQFGIILADVFAGLIIDKNKWYRYAVMATMITALLLILRPFLLNTAIMFVISILIGFLDPLHLGTIFSEYIMAGKAQKNLQHKMADRTILLASNKAVIASLAFFTPLQPVVFIIAGIACVFAKIPLSKINKIQSENISSVLPPKI